ncbi:septal ring lytic transglycosylase RlpA family protein [Diaphorobacter caeni]|uniref:septal ring lytic transglycosylase RlpA family protein n=1 Tax=Diaphorobacter caeni TaxID=2784387 RepID=UPI0018901B6D|nr:septal ring lytic transglycosylase RlpA family protein [Diaphorobacter caeni]MBF5003963.1 septal ring lytic transglycosylase RlpA family protein [Diaphorobacter caeni]
MNSVNRKDIPLIIATTARAPLHRFIKAGGSLLLGVLLAGCAVQPTAVAPSDTTPDSTVHAKADAAVPSPVAPAETVAPTVTLRPRWSERTWSGPPAAVEVNKGSVTPYPGEPESGEGVTAYGAGLRPPVDRSASKPRDEDDDGDVDDVDTSIPGVLIDKGLASWYGGQFHGRLTANGERFDREDMTAAHRTLPFGSKLCVRNISTGKTVMVRVNDRGPFAPGRVIDLSQGAARELGIQGLGIKQVELWKLHKGSDSCPDALLTAEERSERGGRKVVSRMPLAEVSASAKVSARSANKSSGRTAQKHPHQAAGKASGKSTARKR